MSSGLETSLDFPSACGWRDDWNFHFEGSFFPLKCVLHVLSVIIVFVGTKLTNELTWRTSHTQQIQSNLIPDKVRFILHSSFVFGLFHLLAWISVLWHNKYEFDPSLNQLPVHFAVSDALPSSHGRAAVRSYTYFNRKSIAYSSFYLKTLYVEVPKCCFYRHTQACYLLPRIEEMTVTAINAGTLPALSLHRTKRVISLSLFLSL